MHGKHGLPRAPRSWLRALPTFAFGAALFCLGRPVAAQTPAARPEDVSSIDAIVAAVYDVISGPAGQERDWDRFRSLFAPGARLMPTGRSPETGATRVRPLTPEEFVQQVGPGFAQNGFFEREIGRVGERYGNIAHLFSTYDSKRSLSDAQPFMRGINSFQLMYDGTRWWVVSIFWQNETPEHPIPAKYLNKQ